MRSWIEPILAVLLFALAVWLLVISDALGANPQPLPSMGSAALDYPPGPPPSGAESGARRASSLLRLLGYKMAETEAQFIDRTWLRPHNSLLTGDMVVACGKWYSPSETRRKFKAVYLAVCACETSLGDPRLGGRLVPDAFNFGCVKSGSPHTPWGEMAVGTISVGGQRWWKWPTAWTGAAALGRLLKVGPGSRPGLYLKLIQSEDWRTLTGTYYGASVPGYQSYHKRWLRYYNLFSKRLHEAGF